MENKTVGFDPGAPEGDKTVKTTMKGGKVVKQEEVQAPGQSVILVGCLNPKMIKSINTEAKKQGVEVVMLSDKVVMDYLKIKGVDVPDPEAVTLEAFLADANNRVTAEQQATKLWTVVMGNQGVEHAEEVTFTETQVCHATTLTHKTANELFNLLHAFGLLEWVNPKKREFRLHFFKSYIHSAIQNDVVGLAKTVNNDILRFKKSIESDTNLTDEERKTKLATLKDAVLSSLNF